MKTPLFKKNTKEAQGRFFLENKNGQVVRALDWRSENMHIVYMHDTRRIETIESLEDLKDVEHTLIQSVKKSDVKERSVAIAQVGSLRYLQEVKNVSDSVEHSKDDTKPFVSSLKWISGVGVSVLLLTFVIGYFFKPEVQEVRVVEIVERPQEIQRMRPIQKIVEASDKKKVPQIAKNAIPRKTEKKITQEVSLNQVGALGVFGSLTKSNQRGGINLDNVKTSKGIGRGGSEGSGGMQTSLYGKGLVSAPLGEGQRATGAGGYGTKGAGGGQAGYGQVSLVGSGGSFFQPVKSEAIYEGGLDRAEIDAVIQRHLGEIRYCYEQGLQQKPNLAGRVSMKFLIGSDGYVTSANISNSSLRSPNVEGCITSRLKSWKFPNPRGGAIVKVNYPFVLRRVTDS